MNNAPERIWAVYAEGSESRDELPEVFASEAVEDLYALERCYETTAKEYIRRDIVDDELPRLREQVETLREVLIDITQDLTFGKEGALVDMTGAEIDAALEALEATK